MVVRPPRDIWLGALVGAGIVLLSIHSGSLVSPCFAQGNGVGLGAGRADQTAGLLNPGVPRAGSPRLAVGQAPGVPRVRPVAPHPLASTSDGDLTQPLGAPRPNMWFATGSLAPNLRTALGVNPLALPAVVGADRTVSAALGAGIRAAIDPRSAGRDMQAAPERPAGGIRPGCSDDAMESQLQGGGTFWNGQSRSVVPTQFPRGVYTLNARASADPFALGPAGHPVNLPKVGPAGGWCRPPSVPMAGSSPLETRAFWILVLFPLMGIVVFWLSRGFEIGAIHEEGDAVLASWERQGVTKVLRSSTLH